MDALMAALVAAAAAQVGDRTAWLAAILADRWHRPELVVAMAALALLVAGGVAAAAGALLAPMLAPDARQLMLALALFLQGAGSLFPTRMPDRLEGWRIGSAATAMLGILILSFGDGIQFIVATLAARTSVPALAAIGATLGSLAIVAPAAVMGEAAWLRLPLRGLRLAIGTFFAIAGVAIALSAIGLV